MKHSGAEPLEACDHLIERHGFACFEHDIGTGALAQARVRHAHNGSRQNGGKLVEQVLYLARDDAFTAALDDILFSCL